MLVYRGKTPCSFNAITHYSRVMFKIAPLIILFVFFFRYLQKIIDFYLVISVEQYVFDCCSTALAAVACERSGTLGKLSIKYFFHLIQQSEECFYSWKVTEALLTFDSFTIQKNSSILV